AAIGWTEPEKRPSTETVLYKLTSAPPDYRGAHIADAAYAALPPGTFGRHTAAMVAAQPHTPRALIDAAAKRGEPVIGGAEIAECWLRGEQSRGGDVTGMKEAMEIVTPRRRRQSWRDDLALMTRPDRHAPWRSDSNACLDEAVRDVVADRLGWRSEDSEDEW